MIGLLEEIFSVLTHLPQYFLLALEEIVNLFFTAIQGIIELASLALPPMPAVPKPPAFLETINWFFPLTALLSVLTTVLTAYITFLALRWVWQKAGAL